MAELSVLLFIVVSGSFWEMFTTYSHALCGCSPAGLRLEISLETDKKKKNFIFSRDEKFFLTRKSSARARMKEKTTGCSIKSSTELNRDCVKSLR
jgi:hypothetical protein